MRKLLFIVLLSLSSCASFQISTLNHDPIYYIEGSDAEITVINNEFELQHLLRTDFNFRNDFAQYALSQPISFDWRFNRYNRFNSYYGYSYTPWDRHQMWNDWVWGYPYGNGIGWSYSWNNRRWSSNQWGNYYGWNNGFYNRYRGTNVAYHTGRRGRPINTSSRRVIKQRVTTVTPPRKVITPKPRRVIRNTNNSNIRTKPVRRTRTVIQPVRTITPTRTTTRPLNNTQPTRRINSRRKN